MLIYMLRIQLVDFLWLHENFEFLSRNMDSAQRMKVFLEICAAGENLRFKKAQTALKVTLKR